MSLITASNYSAAGTAFQYADSDTDPFDRAHISTLAKAFDEHTHDSTRGLAVTRVGSAVITTAMLVTDSVDNTILKDDASTDGNRAVTTNHIRDSAITTAKINNSAVTSAKMGTDSVLADAIQAGAVGTAELATNAVTAGKILDGEVGTAELAANAATQYSAALGGSDVTITSVTTYTDLTDMSVTLTSTGGPLLVFFSGSFEYTTTIDDRMRVGVKLDSDTTIDKSTTEESQGGKRNNSFIHYFAGASAASHTIKVQWKLDNVSTTGRSYADRTLVVVELKR